MLWVLLMEMCVRIVPSFGELFPRRLRGRLIHVRVIEIRWNRWNRPSRDLPLNGKFNFLGSSRRFCCLLCILERLIDFRRSGRRRRLDYVV